MEYGLKRFRSLWNSATSGIIVSLGKKSLTFSNKGEKVVSPGKGGSDHLGIKFPASLESVPCNPSRGFHKQPLPNGCPNFNVSDPVKSKM